MKILMQDNSTCTLIKISLQTSGWLRLCNIMTTFKGKQQYFYMDVLMRTSIVSVNITHVVNFLIICLVTEITKTLLILNIKKPMTSTWVIVFFLKKRLTSLNVEIQLNWVYISE